MNIKRLHIHSLPLVALALAVTAIMAATVVALRGGPLAVAVLRPSLQFQSGNYGTVQVSPNQSQTGSEDQPGASIDLPAQPPSSLETSSQTADSVMLGLSLRSVR